MGLFNKSKPKVTWTEQTAPKVAALDFNISTSLTKISDFFGSNINLGKINITKQLLVDSDSSKEDIKKEIQNIVENVFNEIELFIDNEHTHLSEQFWTNLKEENE